MCVIIIIIDGCIMIISIVKEKKYNPISLLCCLHAILIQSNGRLMDIFNILDAFGGIQSNTMKQSL